MVVMATNDIDVEVDKEDLPSMQGCYESSSNLMLSVWGFLALGVGAQEWE